MSDKDDKQAEQEKLLQSRIAAIKDPEQRAQAERIHQTNQQQQNRIRAINDPQARVKRVEAAQAKRQTGSTATDSAAPTKSPVQSATPAAKTSTASTPPPMPPDPYDPSTQSSPSSPPVPPQQVDVNVAEKIAQLSAEVASLRSQVNAIRRRSGRGGADGGGDPFFRVYLGKLADGSQTQYQEQLINDGSFVDGDADKSRRCTSDDDPSAIITPDSDIVPLLEVDDITSGGEHVRRSVLLAGPSGSESKGSLQGQNHTMRTDTQDGWLYDQFVPMDMGLEVDDS